MRVPNDYCPQIAFPEVNSRVQNFSHPRTVFLYIKTNVHHPNIAFQGLEMCVQNVYLRHKAFPDVRTLVQLVWMSKRTLTLLFQALKCVYRTSIIITKPFRISKRYTKRLSTSHMLSGYQNAHLLSSNSFLGGQFVCTERLTFTHSFSRCQNGWLPPRHIENACTKRLSSSPSLS